MTAPLSSGRSQKSTSAPPVVNEVLRSPGKPLDTATRAFMEPRFGHDFSRVRVHTDAKAAQSANALGAQAYTLGPNIVFGAGQFSPQGSRLLAHELAHHVQQESRSPIGEMEIAPEHTPLETEATTAADSVVNGKPVSSLTSAAPRIQRQKTPAATTPTFSVDQADFLKRVQSAIQQMSGKIVATNTLATQVNPILSEMLTNVTWRDEKGKDHGGGSIQHTLPLKPPVKVSLQLILDDQSDPPDDGLFVDKGTTSGTMFVRVRSNTEPAQLTETLFHESLHMMSWFINKLGFSPTSDPDAPETRILRPGSHDKIIRITQARLQQLAEGVNSRRDAGHQLKDDDVQHAATGLVEEVVVRAETEVFRYAIEAQHPGGRGGPGTTQKEISPKEVDHFLFDLSKRFLDTDRAGLDNMDKDNIAKLAEILSKYLLNSTERRFSLAAYQNDVTTKDPPPVNPSLPSKPSFIDKIQLPD